MANGESSVPVTRDYRDVISKVAAVKDLDVDKLEKLLQLQEDWERRQAEAYFNGQMALAQGEMAAISRDATNPATRSRYATLAALDNMIRPIYTKYGLSIDFSEEPYTKEEVAHVVASVRCGSVTRHFHLFMPWTTQGARGGSVSTPTHAKMGAMTYARRGLLKMIFNLAEEDDDGNTAGQRFQRTDPYPSPSSPVSRPARPSPPPPDPAEIESIVAAMERCSTETDLRAYIKSLEGRLDGILGPDRQRIQTRYTEMLTGFRKPEAEAAAAT